MLVLADGLESVQSGAQIVVLEFQPVEPDQRVQSKVRFRRLGKGQAVLGVLVPQRL